MLICITGQTGSGKTTILKIIKQAGYETLEMDQYIHEIYQHGNIGYNLIQQNFGNDYITDAAVNREKLGGLVFTKKIAMQKLNKIMIPIMQNKLLELQAKSGIIFVELAIFLNHIDDFKKYFKSVILVEAKTDLKNKNLLNKIAYIRKNPTLHVGRVNNPIKFAKIKSDFVVDNSHDLKTLEKNVRNVLQIIEKKYILHSHKK